MENEKTSKNGNRIIKDIPRLENDLYRVSAWRGREGKAFLDLRVFYFNIDGKLRKSKAGINVLARLRHEIAAALLEVKDSPELQLPVEGKTCEAALVTTVQISEAEQYQVSKVRGPKNSFVRICYSFKGKAGNFIPSGRKALSILESSVAQVAEALRSPEAEPDQAEAVTEEA